MERGSIVERVRRLLALADGARNENENEVEVAARLASKLMLEHKIEMAEVKRSDFDDFLILGCKVGGKRVPRWRKRLLQVLARYNFCEVLQFRGALAQHRFGGALFLVGHKDDCEAVRLIHDHVLQQIDSMRERALEHLHPPQSVTISFGHGFGGVLGQFGIGFDAVPALPSGAKLRKWKEDFNLGVIDGIYLALKGQRYQEELDPNTRAIVKHAHERNLQFVKENIGEVKKETDAPEEIKDINAYSAGRIAAEELDIGTGQRKDPRGHYLGEGNAEE